MKQFKNCFIKSYTFEINQIVAKSDCCQKLIQLYQQPNNNKTSKDNENEFAFCTKTNKQSLYFLKYNSRLYFEFCFAEYTCKEIRMLPIRMLPKTNTSVPTTK